MTPAIIRWAPALILGATATLAWLREPAERPRLRRDLAEVVPLEIAGYSGTDHTLSPDEVRATDVSSYLARAFTAADGRRFSLYVGYHDRQFRGQTIHSPQYCLPGAGWEALTARFATLETSAGKVTVSRVLAQKGNHRVVVLYWYQGRGRVQASGYWAKWDLLRDAVRSGRTDEALVRIVTPAQPDEETAGKVALAAAATVIPRLFEALP